jgi:ribose transport system substrate-binding protein
VEHSLSDDSPWPLVGTNSFDIGKKIGELIASRGADPLRAAVVYSEKSPGIYTEKDLVGLGLTSVLESRLDAPLSVRVTDLNPLDAEELTYRILRNEPEITTIIYTDTRDTLAATQVLIDMNMVGTVQLVGFGSGEAILDYVEKGILTAAVVTNPHGIGYSAVEMLVEIERYGNASAYVDTGFVIVTAENLESYRKEGERP